MRIPRPIFLSLAIVVVISLTGCDKKATDKIPTGSSPTAGLFLGPDSEPPVSLLAVVSDPMRFHGKRVKLAGVYQNTFERSGLFPSRDLSLGEANGVWVSFGDKMVVDPVGYFDLPRPAFLEGWAIIEGVVDAKSHGHLGQWSATLVAAKIRVVPIEWLERPKPAGPKAP